MVVYFVGDSSCDYRVWRWLFGYTLVSIKALNTQQKFSTLGATIKRQHVSVAVALV